MMLENVLHQRLPQEVFLATLPRERPPHSDVAVLERIDWAADCHFASHGLRIGIRVSEAPLLERLLPHLPPGWEPAGSAELDQRYSIHVGRDDGPAGSADDHKLYVGSECVERAASVEEIIDRFASHLRLYVAAEAQSHVFVHAGVVGWRGRAILIPGRSFSGKSTFVAALLRAGAGYLSDEYALLDDQGQVTPCPWPLSLRDAFGKNAQRCPAEALGATVVANSLPVGLVLLTRYRPGSRWRPRRLEPGPAALALLDNTVPARRRPAAVLTAISQVVSRATLLQGVRGEAVPTAAALLAFLDRAGATGECRGAGCQPAFGALEPTEST